MKRPPLSHQSEPPILLSSYWKSDSHRCTNHHTTGTPHWKESRSMEVSCIWLRPQQKVDPFTTIWCLLNGAYGGAAVLWLAYVTCVSYWEVGDARLVLALCCFFRWNTLLHIVSFQNMSFPILPMGGFLVRPLSSTCLEIPFQLYAFLWNSFFFGEPPPPSSSQNFQRPSLGWVWLFVGTAHCVYPGVQVGASKTLVKCKRNMGVSPPAMASHSWESCNTPMRICLWIMLQKQVFLVRWPLCNFSLLKFTK